MSRIMPVLLPAFALALSAMASSNLGAAPVKPAATHSAAASKADLLPFKATEKTLPNGLKIIIVPTGFPNLVSLQIPVQTGSRNEVELASPASPISSST